MKQFFTEFFCNSLLSYLFIIVYYVNISITSRDRCINNCDRMGTDNETCRCKLLDLIQYIGLFLKKNIRCQSDIMNKIFLSS